MGYKRKNRKSESGQTLILAVLAMVVIVVAIIFLFDLQNIIRTKVKGQTAVDAAALTGARWQMETLNTIGEINMVKACNVLITDVPLLENAWSADPLRTENDVYCLLEASGLLSQMQVRLSFVGPLIGYGAAQQAAKNNGINYDEYWSNRLYEHYTEVASEGGDIFYGEEVTSQSIYGYEWREVYAKMLWDLLQFDGFTPKGVAVEMNSNWASYVDLQGDSDLLPYLQSRAIYTFINSNYWCGLRTLLRQDFGAVGFNWWGTIEIVQDRTFSQESELLPVWIAYSQGDLEYYNAVFAEAFSGASDSNTHLIDDYNVSSEYSRAEESSLWHNNYDDYDPVYYNTTLGVITSTPYDQTTNRIEIIGGETTPNELYRVDPATGAPILDGSGNRIITGYTLDTDYYWNPLPRLTWAIYDKTEGNWTSYNTTASNWYWDTWLRDTFQDGYNYYGAVSYAGATIPSSTLTGDWGQEDEEDGEDKYLGDAMAFGGNSGAGAKINTYASRLETAEKSVKRGLSQVTVGSGAKAFGRIPTEDGYLNPCDINMILPVFEKALVIPYDLERPGNYTADDSWAEFKAKGLPLLGTLDNLEEFPEAYVNAYGDDSWAMIAKYYNALVKLNNPEWRQQGLDWLEAEVTGHDEYDEDGNFVEHVIDTTNADYCNYWRSGGSGPRTGPSTPF